MVNYNDFKVELLKVMGEVLPNRNLEDFDEYELPDTNVPSICFTFLCSEENNVDNYIRSVRDKLLAFPEFSEESETNKFIYEVWKSHIVSHDYWSLNFWLSKTYKFTEDFQP